MPSKVYTSGSIQLVKNVLQIVPALQIHYLFFCFPLSLAAPTRCHESWLGRYSTNKDVSDVSHDCSLIMRLRDWHFFPLSWLWKWPYCWDWKLMAGKDSQCVMSWCGGEGGGWLRGCETEPGIGGKTRRNLTQNPIRPSRVKRVTYPSHTCVKLLMLHNMELIFCLTSEANFQKSKELHNVLVAN